MGSHTKTSIRTIGDRKVKFEWSGGQYIELGWVGRHPVEVINVWDYDTGAPDIPFTDGAFRRVVTDWIEEYGRDDLAHDLAEHYGGR